MEITLEKGKKYFGTFELSGLEIFGTNNRVRSELEKLGFTNVAVDGKGKIRQAVGTWAQETKTLAMPKQVKTFRES